MPPSIPVPVPIPRFLLPQRSLIWHPQLRHASHKITPKKTTAKPLVLEKPAKFTPPSHPQRLKKAAPRYSGPALSDEELARQKTKKYPNMMPPEGTLMFKLLTNRSIHLYFTLGTLFTLASTVWITNFKRNSPFAAMLPSWTQLFLHPIAFFRTVAEVIRLDGERTTAETMERRRRKVEDVAKRAAYRKAHGLDQQQGFGGWTAKSDEEMLGPGIPVGDMAAAGVKVVGSGSAAIPAAVEEVQGGEEARAVGTRKPLRKWLGIW